MILNKIQAQTVYEAMVVLNNLGGKLGVQIPAGTGGGHVYNVIERADGAVIVSYAWGGASRDTETYADQNEFAAAYSLD